MDIEKLSEILFTMVLNAKLFPSESLQKQIENFKLTFPVESDFIFSDTRDDIDSLKDCYNLKQVPYVHKVSYEDKNTFHHSSFLTIESGEDYIFFKKWIIIDNSLYNKGVVFESDDKEECLKWIKFWE